ncbi:MAG: (d)CMP kinase [bacterium]
MKGKIKHIIVAIDGPAGVGKTTVAKKVADELGIYHIDTGAMYRALALVATKKGVDVSDEDRVKKMLIDIKLDYIPLKDRFELYINGDEVSDRIRTKNITKASSDISVYKSVREYMVSLQRELGEKYDVVMEGRDIGTVVFPNAKVKIFLTASLLERTRRRMKQDGIFYSALEFKKNMDDIKKRDENDAKRAFAPLRPAPDAKIIDTTCLSFDEVVNIVIEGVKRVWDIS